MPSEAAELQFVGWRRDEGEQWLRLRRDQLGDDKRALILSADFSLTIAWRGPDADLPGPPRKDGSARNKFHRYPNRILGTARDIDYQSDGRGALVAPGEP